MKRLGIIAGIWIIISGFAIAQTVEFLHPKIIEYGKIPQGEVIKGEIRFVNNGEMPLELDGVRPSCGCTAVKPDKMTFAAGETAVIPYEVKTVNFHGIIRKTIQLTFKNATAEKETIVIQANVTTDMSINPRYVNFRNLSLNPDTTYTEFFEIENGSENSLAVTRIFSENAALKVTPAEVTIPPGKSHLIRLEFIPNKAGRQNAKVVIETNNPRVSSQNLSVFINVKENKAARSE